MEHGALTHLLTRRLAATEGDALFWRAAQALCDVRRMAAARLVAGALEERLHGVEP